MTNKLEIDREQFESANPVPFGVFWSEPDSRYMTTMMHLNCLEYQGKWLGWQSAMRAAPVFDPAKCGVCGQGAWACNEGGCHYLESGNGAPVVDRQEPVALTIPEECPHLIVFDDTERENMLFAGAGARSAALKTWEKISMSWNAHLFVRAERNSRDDRYPSAKTAPVAVVLPEFEPAFEAWWESDGQYCRAGGGSYEKTFAYRAYEAAIEKVKELNQ